MNLLELYNKANKTVKKYIPKIFITDLYKVYATSGKDKVNTKYAEQQQNDLSTKTSKYAAK
jgi:hypothetical protein